MMLDYRLAERVGFEPTVHLRAQRFSRPSDSTTLAPLRLFHNKLADVFVPVLMFFISNEHSNVSTKAVNIIKNLNPFPSRYFSVKELQQ